jgi:multiple sugar transport system ATP-binding protein
VLKKGKLQQFASPAELYDRPANAFVAGFIGSPSMNMLTAEIVSDGVRVGDSVLELERDQLTALHDAKLESVTVGIRPEHMEVSNAGGIEAIVDLVEDLGSESYIYAHAKPGVQLVARCLDRTGAKLADTVRLSQRAEGVVHLFHPDTGEVVGK